MMFGYSLLLGVGLLASAPWWLLRMATTARYREGLRERLGRVPARLLPSIAGRRVVWLHAVSVGEVLAASRLVRELETALPAAHAGRWRVVVSTTTRTGQALARERFGPERVFYFPLDFRWAVRAWLRVLRPALVILTESELWPRLLHECGLLSVPVAVVNARMSDRSFRRAVRVRRLWRRVLHKVSLFLAQSDETGKRLLALGAEAGKVCVTGNLKYDVRATGRSRLTETVRALANGRPIVVAGSTLAGDAQHLDEDRLLIQAWEGSPRRTHGALLVLAPRHPERFADVIAEASEFRTLTASDLLSGESATARSGTGERPIDIVVLNTIGDLADLYAVATVAFIGGTLVKKGGHNPLEPARFGIPVIMGSSYENFREVVEQMREAAAISIVPPAPPGMDGRTGEAAWLRDQLRSRLEDLLGDPGRAPQMGERGRQVFEREGGATARSVEQLLALLSKEQAGQEEQVRV